MIDLSKFLPFFIPNVYRACSFFTNLDLFCIDNARVIYRKIRYSEHVFVVEKKMTQTQKELSSNVMLEKLTTHTFKKQSVSEHHITQ